MCAIKIIMRARVGGCVCVCVEFICACVYYFARFNVTCDDTVPYRIRVVIKLYWNYV